MKLGVDELLLECVAEAEKARDKAEDVYYYEAWLTGHLDEYEQKIREAIAGEKEAHA